MANLKEIRGRITSVNSTRQITSAMKMVAAAKLRRAQDAITQMRPYAQKLQEILTNLSASLDTSENVYAEEREVERVLLVPITSNRGLAGAFNSNVIKKTNQVISGQFSDKEVSVLALGKKAFETYRKREMLAGVGYPETPYEIFDDLSFENVAEIAEIVMRKFRDGKIDRVVLIYNSFKNAAVQELQVEQMLPIVAANGEEGSSGVDDYIYEPSKKEIVVDLIPKSLKIQLYKALLDSYASEHGARMTAMHQATENATDLLKDLKLTYNKARQAAITGEILEIVSGAEALADS